MGLQCRCGDHSLDWRRWCRFLLAFVRSIGGGMVLRYLCLLRRGVVPALIPRAPRSGLGAAAALRLRSRVCCTCHRLNGVPAQRIAKPEEHRAQQRQSEEDAQNRGCSERDLTILCVRFVKILQIVVPIVSAVHGQTFFSSAASGVNVLLSRFISSIGSGKTIVVFFSTPISVSVCR